MSTTSSRTFERPTVCGNAPTPSPLERTSRGSCDGCPSKTGRVRSAGEVARTLAPPLRRVEHGWPTCDHCDVLPDTRLRVRRGVANYPFAGIQRPMEAITELTLAPRTWTNGRPSRNVV